MAAQVKNLDYAKITQDLNRRNPCRKNLIFAPFSQTHEVFIHMYLEFSSLFGS